MFIIHTANNSENLLRDVVDLIKNQPLVSVFSQETFLVANSGTERWLLQQLAQHLQVFANYQFFLPTPFFKHYQQKISHAKTATEFAPEQLLWQIESFLRDLNAPEFQPLQGYLQSEPMALKRYQLAGQLSQLFQHYQLVCPDLLNTWQQGLTQTTHPAEQWQRALWQKIIAQNPGLFSESLWQNLCNTLQYMQPGESRYQFPERLIVFSLTHLSALELECLLAFAKHCDVHFYGLTAFISAFATTKTHPLLAHITRAEYPLSDNILQQTQIKSVSPLDIPTNNLQQIQHDIANQSLSTLRFANDYSIRIHACHSRMREIEVLKNELLHTLETQRTLELRECVVVAPDISLYAPYISAVFQEIPHTIAGHSLQDEQSLLAILISFLKLCDSRMGWQSVLDVLEQTAVYASFELSPADLILIKQWLTETHLRWGKSAAHREQLGLPAFAENTWLASLERLLMGYAMATENELIDGILPYPDIEGLSAQALGGLCDFMQLLFDTSNIFVQPHCFKDWSAQLYQLAERLFSQAAVLELAELNAVLLGLDENFATIHQQALDLPVIIQELENQLTQTKMASGLLRGQLTFCNMQAVCGIPFQVIAILGMNEDDFPTHEHQLSFDLSAFFSTSHLSQRDTDRLHFIELFLAARQQLLITYQGQSLAQNQTMPPSVVVSELLDVLRFDYQVKNAVIQQPLQPFSARYFENAAADLFNYASSDYETALALTQEKLPPSVWWQGNLATPPEQVIDLTDIFHFYRHPQRHFLRHQLDLRLQEFALDAPECEPFELDKLTAYKLCHDWIAALLAHQSFDVGLLQAQGTWLVGSLGEVEFSRLQSEINKFVARIDALNLGEKSEEILLDYTIAGHRLVGKLAQQYAHGSLLYRFSSLKSKDLLVAILHHALINQQQAQTTYLLSIDATLTLTPEMVHAQLLPELFAVYCQGLQRPDALWVDGVLDYVKQAALLKKSSRATKSAYAVARDKLQLALEQPFEPELQRLYASMTDETLLLNENFVRFCEELILPIWEMAIAE